MSQFKIKAKVRFWGGIYFIRRTIYRRAKVLGFRLWMPVEVKDFGPFNSYLSAYSLVQENGGECFTI